ncbi:MAG: hypothetical protein RLZZ15_3816 [Verrucomicrobiota bacterium]|jgi:UPF0271 protein
MRTLDLNCDLGEGAGHDAEMMPLITSANLACGAHAGDAATMRATFALAVAHDVRVGAHPGFADRANFGRVEQPISPEAAVALVLAQVARCAEIAGDKLRHVKLHGALYNQVSRDAALAAAVADALHRAWPELTLFALAGSELLGAARARRMRVASEVFADRTYQRDGTLTPRARADALIRDERVAVAQVLRMVREGVVRATDGTDVPVVAGTVCLHGDGPDPVGFARRLRAELAAAGVEVRPIEPRTFG